VGFGEVDGTWEAEAEMGRERGGLSGCLDGRRAPERRRGINRGLPFKSQRTEPGRDIPRQGGRLMTSGTSYLSFSQYTVGLTGHSLGLDRYTALGRAAAISVAYSNCI